jgi:hypothetical protein
VKHRAYSGLAAALAALVAAAPAGADPNPAQRIQASERAAALQEQYYMTHKPAIPGPGHDFGSIDGRAEAPLIAEPPSSSDFQWGDAAIGAGSAIGLMLAFAGGAVAISRRRPAAP